MCGIFGYVGTKRADTILLEGLRTLEYRGYDSAGVYIAGVGVIREVGKVANLEALVAPVHASGTSGIAHTRWATHGEPSVVNSHPHTDSSGKIHVVHNGIIENWAELKTELQTQGITFTSKTDTEVLAKLIGVLYKGNLKEAVAGALQRVKGTYGLAVMSEDSDGEIIVSRMGSPIVLGVGTDEFFISSDTAALLPYTKKVIYLEDGEIAVVTKSGFAVSSISGETRQKSIENIYTDTAVVQKDGYEHFMLKEIFEGGEVILNTIRGRVLASGGLVKLGGLESVSEQLQTINRLVIVGCGSAYYAGMVGRLMIEEYAGIPVEVELGSEYRYKRQLPGKDTAVLAVTQSGETADTLASIRLAKELGLLTLGMVNTVGSTISRETDAGVHNHAGPEIAVASTKAFISQLTVFVLLTVFLGRQNGNLNEEDAKEILNSLEKLPEAIGEVLLSAEKIKVIAQKYASARDFMYIGRKFHAPIAYEGSLKLKEVSYIHAEAYAGGELKHGSIAMLGPDFPVLAIVPEDDVYSKMMSNIEEVKARRAPVVAITTVGATGLEDLVDDVIYIPKVHPLLQPIISTIPLQLFAYYIGVVKGLDVDRPRNLAKSVTVE